MQLRTNIVVFCLLLSLALSVWPQTSANSEAELLADREFEQGFVLRSETILAVKSVAWEESVENYREAIARFIRARDLYRQAGNRRKEATSVWRIAELQKVIGELDNARKNLDEAIRIYTEIGDRLEAGKRKISLGDHYLDAADYYTAIKIYNEALAVAREVKDTALESESLTMIGVSYSHLFNRPEAIRYWEQAVKVSEASGGGKYHRVATLEMIAKAYADAAERQKALEYYSRALAALGQPADHAEKLKLSDLTETVAKISSDLGDVHAAITVLESGVKGDRFLGFKQREAEKLMELGLAYRRVGNQKRALQALEESLALFLELKSSWEPAVVMLHISQLHLKDLHAVDRALVFADRGTKIAEESGEPAIRSLALVNLADVVSKIPGRAKEEIGHRQKALEISRSINNHEATARLTEGIGIAYYRAGNYRDAAGHLNEALMTYVVLGMATDLNGPLYWLQQNWRAAGNVKLATAFGKQGIRALQEQRKLIANVNVEGQRTYLRSVEKTYRSYVAFLFEQKRLSEAHQALTAFKDQQSLDVAGTPEKKYSIQLTPTPREARLWMAYVNFADNIITAKRNGEELRGAVATRQPTPEEISKIKAADDALNSAWNEFYAYAQKAPAEFEGMPDKHDEVPLISENELIRTAIKDVSVATKQNTAAVYQLVSEYTIDSLIVTKDEIKHVSVKAAGTNEKARKLWALLQSDKYDPRPLGKDLYDVVFKPIEKELPADTKTILWSLDGNLRYVPMGALYDGKQYLTERYNNVIFTRADGDRLTRSISPNWNASAFGSSKPHTVENLGDRVSFSALPGVTNELTTLFGHSTKPVMNGNVLLDDKFTRDAMLKTLAAGRPVAHIASHFSFRPGDDSRSFLLLGDGTAFTLADMKKQKDMFAGIELLTLSACNTAAQQADANGREVDAFFELAQRLGAQSVLATLWPVADNSTPWLMREFYGLKINKKQNKAEALRNAQLALLKGTAKASPSTVRSDASSVNIVVEGEDTGATRGEHFVIPKKEATLFVTDPKRPFAHPYYWSPFVLIGNWR